MQIGEKEIGKYQRWGDFSIAECACLPVGRDCRMRNLMRLIGG